MRAKPRRLTVAQRNELAATVLERFASRFPTPRCELEYRTDFHLLVSVVLSAQTTDKAVNACMTPLYDEGFDPHTAVSWGAERFCKKIRTIGLAPTKAKNVVKISKLLLEHHGGEVPRSREALEALPGVGRKTANVILGELFGEPTLAVDTHVYRVTRRLGFHDESNAEACEQKLLKLVDAHYLPAAHHWFILHGRYTCKARAPQCGTCLLNDVCPSTP